MGEGPTVGLTGGQQPQWANTTPGLFVIGVHSDGSVPTSHQLLDVVHINPLLIERGRLYNTTCITISFFVKQACVPGKTHSGYLCLAGFMDNLHLLLHAFSISVFGDKYALCR